MVFNTGETQEQLREKYNPEGSNLRIAQLRMLDMLKYFDKLCREIGVEYQITGGTLLGAIRHCGFIPWDDDTDVIVPRKDYKRLCDYLKKYPHPQYVLQDHTTDTHYFNFWSVLRDLKSEYIQEDNVHKMRKFRGMQIDIFPIDHGILPRLQRIAHSLNYKFVYINVRRNKIKQAKRNFRLLNSIVFPIFRLGSKIFGDKKYYGHAYGQVWFNKYPVEVLFPSREFDFEAVKLYGPNKPKEFLNIEYSDIPYQELPPEDQRLSHNAYCRVWN